jgi:four helix bundle protein
VLVDRVAEDLKSRPKHFATKVLEFVDTLPRTPSGDALARQLARAGLGVTGNYRSACRARSHAEFTARMGVVLDESDESELWLDVSNKRKWGDTPIRDWLLKEAGELRAIFSAAYHTARAKEKQSR